MARSRYKSHGRKEGGTFTKLPHNVTTSEQFANLSAYAVKLLVDMLNQYQGKNNGDLSPSFTLMKRHGWSSKATLAKALAELEGKGFIVKTRQGGRHKASLYAVTWLGIDECDGKLERPARPVPLNYWREGRNPEIKTAAPPHGAMCPATRGNKDKAA
ncbi:MAG: hypothetical protein ACOZAQ_02165 [Pseudomonadota bacterium]